MKKKTVHVDDQADQLAETRDVLLHLVFDLYEVAVGWPLFLPNNSEREIGGPFGPSCMRKPNHYVNGNGNGQPSDDRLEKFLDDLDAKLAALTPEQQKKALKICREVSRQFAPKRGPA